jgi:hypothetical protein
MKRLTLLIFMVISASGAIAQVTDEDTEAENKPAQGIQLRLPTGVGHYMVGANVVFANATFRKDVETSYNIGPEP